MNIDEKRIGLYKWERGESKIAIGFLIANEKAYRNIKSMRIDEEREILDLSDHCMIEVKMNVGRGKKEKWKEWREKYFYRIKKWKKISRGNREVTKWSNGTKYGADK